MSKEAIKIPDEISRRVIEIAREAAEVHKIDGVILENVAFRAVALAFCAPVQKG